jgi:phosphoglycerate dehydrogenase-like enzyme
MLRVHMVREPESVYQEALVEGLKGKAGVTFGGTVPEGSEVLVEGQLQEAHMVASLRHVVIPFAGVQPKTKEILVARPHIRVHNLHHNAAMTAEMAMALMLACARRIVSLHNGFAKDDWEPRYFCRDAVSLHGKTVVVLGFGEIGRRVGLACEGIGMRVVGIRSQPDGECLGIADLHSVLPSADVLMVTLPLTDATEGLIGREEIALLPPHAIVVNVGRGKVIEEQALFEALRDEKIDSAGLDVWWLYPKAPGDKTPPSSYPFSSLPNVVMTPHVGGATRDAEPARMAELLRVLTALCDGDLACNLVDLPRGY